MQNFTPKIHVYKFEELIRRRGRIVQWREAIQCSCLDEYSGQPLYSCQACHGFGYIYGDPVENYVNLASIEMHREFIDLSVGNFEIGDAIMTVPARLPKPLPNGKYSYKEYIPNPMYDIGLFDLITLTDDEVKFSEVLKRNTPQGNQAPDTLMQDDITRIKYVQKIDPVTGQITRYQQGTDFILNGRTIEWIGENQPADGERYSVVYFHRPSFYVYSILPRPRHQDNQDLPRYVVLRYRMGGVTKH